MHPRGFMFSRESNLCSLEISCISRRTPGSTWRLATIALTKSCYSDPLVLCRLPLIQDASNSVKALLCPLQFQNEVNLCQSNVLCSKKGEEPPLQNSAWHLGASRSIKAKLCQRRPAVNYQSCSCGWRPEQYSVLGFLFTAEVEMGKAKNASPPSSLTFLPPPRLPILWSWSQNEDLQAILISTNFCCC